MFGFGKKDDSEEKTGAWGHVKSGAKKIFGFAGKVITPVLSVCGVAYIAEHVAYGIRGKDAHTNLEAEGKGDIPQIENITETGQTIVNSGSTEVAVGDNRELPDVPLGSDNTDNGYQAD